MANTKNLVRREVFDKISTTYALINFEAVYNDVNFFIF